MKKKTKMVENLQKNEGKKTQKLNVLVFYIVFRCTWLMPSMAVKSTEVQLMALDANALKAVVSMCFETFFSPVLG